MNYHDFKKLLKDTSFHINEDELYSVMEHGVKLIKKNDEELSKKTFRIMSVFMTNWTLNKRCNNAELETESTYDDMANIVRCFFYQEGTCTLENIHDSYDANVNISRNTDGDEIIFNFRCKETDTLIRSMEFQYFPNYTNTRHFKFIDGQKIETNI